MAGMMTSSLSGSDTTVAFTVTGLCRQNISKTSNAVFRVPRSRMSQTMQNIQRMGGTITDIAVGSQPAPQVAPPKTSKKSETSEA